MLDPYLYSGTNILKNKFNIKNQDDLEEMEAEYTSFRLKQIAENKLQGNYDFKHFCEFHKWIFQDIYDWAGVPRTINMYKPEKVLGGISVEYAEAENIKEVASTVLNNMKNIRWNELSLDEKSETFSKCMAELWKVHSFREGNTRTVITFCCQFAESQGFPLDRELFEKNSVYVRSSLVAGSAFFSDLGDKSNIEYLKKIVKDSIEKGEVNKKSISQKLIDCKIRADERNKLNYKSSNKNIENER